MFDDAYIELLLCFKFSTPTELRLKGKCLSSPVTCLDLNGYEGSYTTLTIEVSRSCLVVVPVSTVGYSSSMLKSGTDTPVTKCLDYPSLAFIPAKAAIGFSLVHLVGLCTVGLCFCSNRQTSACESPFVEFPMLLWSFASLTEYYAVMLVWAESQGLVTEFPALLTGSRLALHLYRKLCFVKAGLL